MKKCEQCGGLVLPRTHTGGPEKIYCSDACATTARTKRWSKSQKGREYDRRRRLYPGFQRVRRARSAVRIAVANGTIIKPDCCEICNKEHSQIEAHHEDYSKPLSVVWVCSRCHKQI